MKTKYFMGSVVCFFFVIYWFIDPANIENRFYNNERDFQNAADAYIKEKPYNGVKQWLTIMPAGENTGYLSFHMGNDYRTDFYKPRIVYILSDNFKASPTCSFDGKLIKKLKNQWYICQESRF